MWRAIGMVMIVLMACTQPLTEEERRYQSEYRAHPLVFSLAENEAQDAWIRAHLFLQRNCPLRLIRDTQEMLETAQPPSGTRDIFAYAIERRQIKNAFEFTVRCFTYDLTSLDQAKNNAQILAFYIANGVIKEQFLYGAR